MLTELQDDPLRPLIFIAHCFGGLVILKVICLTSNGTLLTLSRLS